jgi:elongator complex protein 2
MPPTAGDLAGVRAGAEAERVFIGAGCNRVVNNVSWGACGLVAFGAQNAVALFSPSVRPSGPPTLHQLIKYPV